MVQALKLPLAGYRFSGGSTFLSRGNYTNLWSSTVDGSNARARHLDQNFSSVLRNSWSKAYGFSVRCIKD